MSDYIERENAKHAVCGCTRDTGIDEAPFEYAESLLENVPSADVAPVRHGRWEVIDAEEPRRYGCSECKRLSWNMENYCGNCGARMDGDSDETD